MRELVHLAGGFRWAAEISPSVSLCTHAILILLLAVRKTSPAAKETSKKKKKTLGGKTP